MKDTTVLLPKIEEEWCTFHNLVQSSLNNVSEICMYLNTSIYALLHAIITLSCMVNLFGFSIRLYYYSHFFSFLFYFLFQAYLQFGDLFFQMKIY
jgi:hypothetical protein